jgi:hypothetical protein
MEGTVFSRAGFAFFLLGILSAGPVWAQRTAPTGAHATIKCAGGPYVPITADAEQGIPLQLVEKAACGEKVVVLSDDQGYTVQVRTAMGNTGYVARYQIAVDSEEKRSAPAANTESKAEQAVQPRSQQDSDSERDASSKPRVYISDTASWTASGGFGNSSSVAPGDLYGGYNPDMVDIYQDFTSDCAAVAVTQEKSKADFAVLFDKDTSKKGIRGLGGLVKVNKVTVLSRTGETLLTQTAHSPDTAVKMACTALGKPQSSGASSTSPATKPIR